MSLLQVENLEVQFASADGAVRAVNKLSFEIGEGEALGVVGESGSGKSQTALAIMGLLARNGRAQGRVQFAGQDLLQMPARELNRIRGKRIGMIFQDPMTSLNPHLKIGTQMAEVLELHQGMGRAAALAESARMLERVRIGGAAGRLSQYPHEFSGGQRQRLMIAMTLLCRPQLLIADEPTTALDVTVQKQILELLDELRRELKLAVMLITHDLGIVGEFCERTLVMYAGRLMEYGPTADLLHWPRHPYTRALLASRPSLDTPLQTELDAIPGQPPDPARPPPGCPFEPRCVYRIEDCAGSLPAAVPNGRFTRACIRLEAARTEPVA